MKKGLLISVLFVLLLLCGCGKKDETKKLIVGFDAEFPPYGFVKEDGSYDGFDLALAKEVCKRIGYEYEEVAINWDFKDAELSSGNITCIWNGFTINGREEEYTWSKAYVDNTIVVVVKKDSNIKSLNDLKGRKVMVQAASSGKDAVDERQDLFDQKDLVILGDYNLGFIELDQGSVEAVVIDLGVAKYHLSSKKDTYVILDEAVASEQYGVGFLKGNTELRDLVDAQLDAMAADGTMKKIAEKYVDVGLELSSLCLVKE